MLANNDVGQLLRNIETWDAATALRGVIGGCNAHGCNEKHRQIEIRAIDAGATALVEERSSGITEPNMMKSIRRGGISLVIYRLWS